MKIFLQSGRGGLVVAMLGSLLLVAAPVRAAMVTSNVAVSALEPDFLDSFSVHNSPSGPVSSFLNVEGIPNYPGFHATGTSVAGFGSLGVSAQLLTPNYAPAGFDSGTLIRSQATFGDQLTIPGSGTGFVEFQFNLSGSAANSHSDVLRSFMNFVVSVAGNSRIALSSGALGFYPTGTFSTGLVPITFGVPFSFDGYLDGSVDGMTADLYEGSVVSGIFYGNTAALVGMQAYDANQLPLGSFAVTSDSGINYAALVPLPAMTLPFGLALLGALIGGRRALRAPTASGY